MQKNETKQQQRQQHTCNLNWRPKEQTKRKIEKETAHELCRIVYGHSGNHT